MDLTHVHLLINHLPLFGSVLGALVLGYGLYAKSNPTKIAAYMVLIISAVGAVVAYYTGEPAEDAVKNLQGIVKQSVEEHEDAAVFAFGSMIVVGLFSIVGLMTTVRNTTYVKLIGRLTLLLSLFSFSVLARTAYLGGLIRHTEVKAAAALAPGSTQQNETVAQGSEKDEDTD